MAQVLVLCTCPAARMCMCRYSEGTDFVNAALEQYAAAQRQVSYLDCSQLFLTANGTLIRRDAMPDAQHPNAHGLSMLAACLRVCPTSFASSFFSLTFPKMHLSARRQSLIVVTPT